MDPIRRCFVLKFSQGLVHAVESIIQPGSEKESNKTEHFIELLEPLRTFLDRYKMELYFVFAEELVRFGKELNEGCFRELLESMMADLQEDKYDPQVFAWYCVLLAFYGVIAKRRGVKLALRTSVSIIIDAIVYFENDDEIEGDVVDDIKNSLKQTAQRIEEQNKSASS